MFLLLLVAIAGWLSVGLTAPTTSEPQSWSLVKRSQPIFQNFDDANNQDVEFKIQLQSAWSNSITLMATQLDVGFDNPIFSHYFGDNDKEVVKRVLDAMYQGSPNEGSFLLSSIIIDNEDFRGECVANRNQLCYSDRLLNRGINNALQVHCCMQERTSQVRELSGAGAITCDELGNMVTYDMLTLSAALFHEYLHFDLIGGENLAALDGWPAHIGDIGTGPPPFNEVTDPKTGERIPTGYGPYRSRALQQVRPEVSTRNADSYMWLVLENYWTKTCPEKTGFTGPRKPGDQKVPAVCGGNNENQDTQSCVIQ